MNDIVEEARRQVASDLHRAAVEAEKRRIRENLARPWWKKLFPWRVEVTVRRDA